MKLEDAMEVQKLLNALTVQMNKKEKLDCTTNIHIQMNGPSQSVTHLNFSDQTLSSNSLIEGDGYYFEFAHEFVAKILDHQIDSIRVRLAELGVNVQP